MLLAGPKAVDNLTALVLLDEVVTGGIETVLVSLTVSNLYKGTAPYQYGDVDGDMIVTMADLTLEGENYGRQCVVVGGLSSD